MDAHATHATDATTTNSAGVPTPPTERELAILQRILDATHVTGIETLRDQLRMLQVAPSSDATCRIYLVHPDAPKSSYSREGRRKIAPGFPVHTPQRRLLGEVNVWVEDGHLRALQYVMPDARDALALPRPEWVDVPPPPIPASVRLPGAMQSMSGVWALGASPVREFAAEPVTAAPTTSSNRSVRRILEVVAATLCVLAIAAAAFIGGRSGGEDLDAARAAGADAGAIAGEPDGATLGAFDGDTQGRTAGRASTYQTSFIAARAQGIAAARRAKLLAEQRRSDAAKAAFTATYGFLCTGSVDANGNWACA